MIKDQPEGLLQCVVANSSGRGEVMAEVVQSDASSFTSRGEIHYPCALALGERSPESVVPALGSLSSSDAQGARVDCVQEP